jgi:hypothetical protein
MDKDSKTSFAAPTAVSDIETASFDEKPRESNSKISGWVKNVLLSVETSGIQRVTDEERQHNTTKVWNACTFWYVFL